MENNPYVKLMQTGTLPATDGTMYATLALAWEVRTQSLLAYVSHDPAVAIINDNLDPTIRQRLGLPEYTPKEIP